MSDLVTQSPFDAGRTPCPQGGEDRWSARWLMEQMGYDTWENFASVIERAKTAAHTDGFNPSILFRAVTKKTGGRPQADYQVTRFAAYLIAMNGHTSKPEVASAQTYFAVKTREAEVAAPKTLTGEALFAHAVLEAQKMLAAKDEQIAELTPKAEFYDEFMDADGAYSFKATADALCWGRTTMLRNLRQAGVLTSKNLPYRRYAHHFKVVPQTYTTRNGETVATATTYVLPSGVAFIAKKLDGISI